MIIFVFLSDEDVTPYVPDVDEEDFGDLEESEEGQSPIWKSTREGSPDNGSQSGCSSSDNGSQGGSASNPDYEIDSSNLGGREEDQSPTWERAREGSPDYGSQHEYTSDRGRARARGRGSARGGGRARGRGTTGGKGKARGRGKARGKGRTKGRGTGRGKTGGRRGSTSTVSGTADEVQIEGQEEKIYFDFDDSDNDINVLPPFASHRPPGIHLERPVLRGGMTTELDFFLLFITPQMVSQLCCFPC